ncbi:hypothetical protein WOLCODRAFT_138184 [Wolfiporia cocos MD-104 SS10]|uniref:Bromodomain associated domain-containing protein n=1 Tax=Wolfiporia cocos (strain MD-104) TaxID=742152 RepID=A0A2H3K201_WOLCO|nr:hypothetical protein WOLCODRAFT_138184 [Wolfiporia cocos MD-104 SS10]
MDAGARKALDNVTQCTLHAHGFSRASSLAAATTTDVLARYLALLTSTCAKYAEHAGRLSLSIRDAASALDELGVGVDELREYATTEGRDVARYAVRTARRAEDLKEFKAVLDNGLKEDRDDAIPLVYARIPSPSLSEDESEDEDVESTSEESETEETHKESEVQVEKTTVAVEDEVRPRDADASPKRKLDADTMPPPLPLSPISNPSTPPRKRQRTNAWQPPSYVPDFLPPFPTAARSPSPPPSDVAAPDMVTLSNGDIVKPERLPTPPPPAASLATSLPADYLAPIPYTQSSLASSGSWHLPSPPESDFVSSSSNQSPNSRLPQIQPALLGAYHHVLTHPPSSKPPPPNPARYRVALALVTQSEANPRWEPPPTLFASSASNLPRVAPVGPSYPVPANRPPGTPVENGKGDEKESRLPGAPPRPVISSERIAPTTCQQGSRIPTLARQVLPGPVHARTTRLSHPPVLQRGTQKLTYGPGVNAPWNTNSPTTPAAPLPPNGLKKQESVNGTDGKDGKGKVLQDARLYSTWDYDMKRFNEPLVVRRGLPRVPTLKGKGESKVS